MSLSWPTVSQVLASPTRWEHQAPMNKITLKPWVRYGPGISFCVGLRKLTAGTGVIPRAAQLLFEKLDGTPTHTRSVSTGIRTPSRYSMSSTTGFGKNGTGTDKSWQLKATYVEVSGHNIHVRDGI